MTLEHDIQDAIRLALGRFPFVRIFRNNIGQGWIGKLVTHKNGMVCLAGARPLHAGLFNGSSDLIGWKTVMITPEMVGQRVAVFVSLEVKSETGRTSDEQDIWLANVQRAGGIAHVVRSQEEAMRALDL